MDHPQLVRVSAFLYTKRWQIYHQVKWSSETNQNKFGKVNKALEENQKLILNFNPRIYIGEDGNETDNDFDD